MPIPNPSSGPPPGGTLLCVDDERAILHSLRRVLRAEGYRLLFAESTGEALALLEEESVDVLLADYRMPGASGAALLAEARRRRPEVVRMTLTGYADPEAHAACVGEGGAFRFLTKPWDDDDLRAALRDCFAEAARTISVEHER